MNSHADPSSVARVRPRTSKGITDLLLLPFMRLKTAYTSKKMIDGTRRRRCGGDDDPPDAIDREADHTERTPAVDPPHPATTREDRSPLLKNPVTS